MGRAVLTLAVGKPVYVQMAVNLARSFRWWHHDDDIAFLFATDRPDLVPLDVRKFVVLIELTLEQYGRGFSPKLHLDQISTAHETLFLDADCLCAANLKPVFAKFQGCEVSVIGRQETEGELFGDITVRRQAVGAPWVPRFCGGIYYFRRGPVCEQVFRIARELEPRYDELGLVKLRGVPNEEPLIGLGMALAGQRPVPEDGSIKAEPMFFSSRTELDVFAGTALLQNTPGHPKLCPEWQIPDMARPAVVHFNASFAEQPPYTTEALRLEKVMAAKWPLAIATWYAVLMRTLPFLVSQKIKQLGRPQYHAWFGPRPVRPTARVS